MRSLTLTGIEGIPLISRDDDLAKIICRAATSSGLAFQPGDILVVCQKIVSKAEGRIKNLGTVAPSALARNHAARFDKDPRTVQLALENANRIVRMRNGVLIVETGPGWVCANAGVDESNSISEETAILLPEDADASARRIRAGIKQLAGVDAAVVISDTFGRPWREGLTEICLGISGMNPLLDLRGTNDLGGRELHHTIIAIADEIASAAGLLMEKSSGIPAVLVRGYEYKLAEGNSRALIRPAENDLFR
ncbi:MAG: coenzyme F420-0:L-glutamate ligase [Candidatus Binataceae bacterium]